MKSEELLDAIGNISYETVQKNEMKMAAEDGGEPDGKKMTAADDRRKNRQIAIRTLSMAAAVLLVLAAGGLLHNRKAIQRTPLEPAEYFDSSAGDAAAAEEYVEEEVCEDAAADDMEWDEAAMNNAAPAAADAGMQGADAGVVDKRGELIEKYVRIDEMLPAKDAGVAVEDTLRIAQVKVGSYTAQYECVPEAVEHLVKDSLGRKVEQNEDWYRVSGHNELGYLINVSDDRYTLWKFGCFLAEEYPYQDVLELVYDVSSADEFDTVISHAATMDNTEEGQKLQKEIGTSYITDVSDLQALYDILCSLTCYGENHWELIDYGADDAGMLNAVRMGRYLDIVLKNGEDGSNADMSDKTISLKYTAVSGMFYEYGGVAYNRLSAKDKDTVDRMLGIAAGKD